MDKHQSSEASLVNLDDINKYVGYKTKTLRVTLKQTEGYLKKLVNEVSVMQKSLFPERYFVYRRDTGELKILTKPGGDEKHCYKASEIKYVRVSDVMEQSSVSHKLKKDMMPTDYPFLFLL